MSLRITSESYPFGQHGNLLFLGFNQDFGCFTAGTTTGFFIFTTEPFKETFRREFKNGGIGIIEMLYRCNILALVGGGKFPSFPTNKVILWDDHKSQCIGEFKFQDDVRAVKLRRDRIVVVLETACYLYDFTKLELIQRYDTGRNPKGLCAISQAKDNIVLAIPAIEAGSVHVLVYNPNKNNNEAPMEKYIQAHENAISCMALSTDGSLLATASERGTLIRIFRTDSGDKIKELRRGAEKAEIYSIAFSPENKFIVVSSDHGTIHVFALNEQAENRKSTFSVIGSVLPTNYFSSEWSFAWYHTTDVPTICAFTQDNDKNLFVVAVSADGCYKKLFFDPQKGGECKVVSEPHFFDNSQM